MLKIREGEEYEFLVEKELVTPNDSHHFILKGPDQKKYLIPVSVYQHYNITVGSSIKCRIDKINCKGEIFLEPPNPFYTEGESYSFEVVNHEKRTDAAGISHSVFVVRDLSGNTIPVPFEDDKPLPLKGSRINLTVERITKGKVFLVRSSRGLTDKYLKSGKEYEFVIERIEKGMDDEDYFILKDPFGNLHTIAREFYEYYGYKIGTRFKGKIIKYKKNGEKTIEPENPYYKTGSVIRLDVTSFSKNIINNSFTLNLKDAFGFTHCIETSILPEKEYIQCRVVMIKKGKPLLEIL
jgi:hypothetical protein